MLPKMEIELGFKNSDEICCAAVTDWEPLSFQFFGEASMKICVHYKFCLTFAAVCVVTFIASVLLFALKVFGISIW